MKNMMPVVSDFHSIPSVTEVNYAIYKIEKIRWLDGEWGFLLYEKLTITELFTKIFT